MKKVLLFTLSVLFSSLFTGCDDDGGDGNDNGNDIVKLVKSLTADGKTLYEFKYDSQQRITKVVRYWSGGEDVHNLTYGEDMITITRPRNNGDDAIFKLYFDSDGYLTSVGDGGRQYTYSDDGYLKSVALNDDTIAFEWKDGNLIKTGYSADETFTFEYSDIPNVWSVNFNPCVFGEIGFYNFKGTYNKNFPASQTYSLTDFGETSTVKTVYEYSLDKDGYPVSIKEKDTNGGNRTLIVTYY